MKQSQKSTVKTVITMIIIGCLIFGVFMYFANQEDKEKVEADVVQTEVEKLLDEDLNQEYPPTAREVVKHYGRIVKCIHSEELSEEEITKLGDSILVLYSEELIKENSREEYIEQLLSEVGDYQKNDKTITSYAVDSAENIITWTEDGVDYARIIATFTMKEDTTFNKTFEEFLLKMDSQDQWKIIGWRLADQEDM
jgi:hypothetical protein